MVQQVKNNQDKILRFLYHNRNQFKSRREIEDGTGLTETQVRYALDGIKQYLDQKKSDTRGGIQDAYMYHLNSDGRAYLRNEIDEIPQEQKNSEELDKHKKEIMLLRASLDSTKDNLEDWIRYSSDWNDHAQERFKMIEKRLEIIEKKLDLATESDAPDS